jgi:hypothetical protein
MFAHLIGILNVLSVVLFVNFLVWFGLSITQLIQLFTVLFVFAVTVIIEDLIKGKF